MKNYGIILCVITIIVVTSSTVFADPEIRIYDQFTPYGSGDFVVFGDVGVNETAQIQMTIENPSLMYNDLILGTFTKGGLHPINFTIGSPGTTTISPGNSTTFTISFTASTIGTFEANLLISCNATNANPFLLYLQATTTDREINVKQGTTDLPSGTSEYNFGTIQLGNSSNVVTFTIENNGTIDSLLVDVRLFGDDVSDFVLDKTSTLSSIGGGQSTTFTVTFTPTHAGVRTTTLVIDNNDPNENHYTITLKGVCRATSFDFNNDGYDDVVIGAPYNDQQGGCAGVAYIFFGSSNPNASYNAANANVIIYGGDWYDNMGYSVSSAGDFNGDNVDDVIIGAVGENNGNANGYAFIIYGSSTPPSVIYEANADVTIMGENLDDCFGNSVSSAGDFNNDGYDDVIIGAFGDDDAGNHSGSAFIYYGSSSPSSTMYSYNADVIIYGEDSDDSFGFSVSKAGDINNDGYDDVVVGAIFSDEYSDETGAAYIFYGQDYFYYTMPASSADMRIYGENDGDYFGYSVSYAGDVNGDDYDDFIVSAKEPQVGGNYQGKAYIFFGNCGFNFAANASVIITGSNGDHLGTSVSYAGDINMDGYDDIIIGGEWANGDTIDTGCVFMFYGRQFWNANYSTSLDADVTFKGVSSYDYFGCSVCSAGDYNGDGFFDIIIGAEQDTTDPGRAYIFFGSTSLASSISASVADVTFIGSYNYDIFGSSVGGCK